MIRSLLLVLLAPLWLPFRLIGWLRFKLSSRPVLRLSLSGSLPDVPARRGLSELLRRDPGPHLLELLDVLEVARRDPRLSAVLVRIDDLECGLARAEEVRAALDKAEIAAKAAAFARDALVPQAERSAALAERAHELGDTTVLTLLQARRTALEARRTAVDARLEAALARIEAERAAGAPLTAGPRL